MIKTVGTVDKSAVQVLREAKYLLQAGWTQGVMSSEVPIMREDPGDNIDKQFYAGEDPRRGGDATKHVCFCAMGAVDKIIGDVWSSDAKIVLSALQAAIGNRPDAELYRDGSDDYWVPYYNDKFGRTKEEMLSLFDDAIDIALKDEQKGTDFTVIPPVPYID